jgi:hypothetical protein
MRLPLRFNLRKGIPLGARLLFAVGIVLATPKAALAWHGDDGWRPSHYGWHHHGWGGQWFVPPPFGVRVYPGYYPAPVYSAPYYPGPPAFVLVPPTLSFGFNWVFRR